MRLAIVSDIHANLQAFEAVLADIDRKGADAIVCCGDVVGYGGDPEACVDLVRERCAAVVLGNHDLAVANGTGLRMLPPEGREAARLHRHILDDERKHWLAGLPDRLEIFGVTLVHAAPEEPRSWMRLEAARDAARQFDHFATDLCFFGHTHIPGVMSDQLGVFSIRHGRRYLVNVGSVGQPRDGDPRACVGYFETETFAYELSRVAYSTAGAAGAIRAAGLSEGLGARLHTGR